MTDIFAFRVNASSTGGIRFDTSVAKFGDGYEQESPNGLLPAKEHWNVEFSGYKVQAQAVKDWLVARIGQAFYWKPPLGVTGYYKCREIANIAPQGGGYFVLALVFEQVNAP